MPLLLECVFPNHSVSEDQHFSLSQLLYNNFLLQAHVLAKLINCNNLVMLFTEVVFNLLDKISAIPVASACDYHYILWVNTQSIHYFNYTF